MRELIMEAIKLLAMALAFVITRYAVPWLVAKTQNDRMALIIDWVAQAVLAAEQVHQAPGSGPERKRIVIAFIKKILAANNISITDEELDTIIEAAVMQLNLEKKNGGA